jgi:hypothetical protein
MASKYDNFYEQVITSRLAGKSWAAIAVELKSAGCPGEASAPTVFMWFMRRQKKARRLVREMRHFRELDQMKRVEPMPQQHLPVPLNNFNDLELPIPPRNIMAEAAERAQRAERAKRQRQEGE